MPRIAPKRVSASTRRRWSVNFGNHHSRALEALVRDARSARRSRQGLGRVLAELERLLQGTALLRELTPRALDTISGMGERLSTPLLAARF